MAIKIIKQGEVVCDGCQKVVAKIKTSLDVFKALENNFQFSKVLCADCLKTKEL